ncbi:MAG: hypothetical protein JNN15_07045 [Blastocatellia bacterium]|nr:hypothetical protein [Blastocatellia bacterium]
MKKLVTKLSFWGFLSALLFWALKYLLDYLFFIITPWINWLIAWSLLILFVLLASVSLYLGYRFYAKRDKEASNKSE